MTDDLTLVRRAELRERAEWIREHHPTHPPARILVPVDDMLALLDALDAAERAARDVEYLTAERDQLLADADTPPEVTAIRARRDAALADLMAPEQPEHEHYGDTFTAGTCCGDSHCRAPRHVHGCYADADGTTCDDPGEHPDQQ